MTSVSHIRRHAVCTPYTLSLEGRGCCLFGGYVIMKCDFNGVIHTQEEENEEEEEEEEEDED